MKLHLLQVERQTCVDIDFIESVLMTIKWSSSYLIVFGCQCQCVCVIMIVSMEISAYALKNNLCNVTNHIQKAVKMLVRIYLKKRLFVEFVSLSCVRVAKHLRWNAAVKGSLLWLIKSVL